jgi:glycosyltransferase involved in cell wall biosynthesis
MASSTRPRSRLLDASVDVPDFIEPIPVSVVIAVRNEASAIVGCIDSVRWAAEILVADHGSSDRTVDIAASAGAICVDASSTDTIGLSRNVAIARATNHWILVVDADERGSPELAHAVAAAIARPASAAYRVPRRNFFMGREVRHGGWDQDRPVRLFDRRLRYNDSKVHEHVVTNGDVATLAASLLHYPYATMDVYFEKFDRYSRWWAADQAARGRRASVLAIIFKPPARFISMYVLRAGFLDGARGVVLASLAAASVCAKYVRLWALRCEF